MYRSLCLQTAALLPGNSFSTLHPLYPHPHEPNLHPYKPHPPNPTPNPPTSRAFSRCGSRT